MNTQWMSATWVAGLLLAALALPAHADDSCQFANDGMCDEPEYCATGTDTTDCLAISSDTVAEESTGSEEAIDPANSCQYAFDGACDEPTYCYEGTDTADCSNAGSSVPAETAEDPFAADEPLDPSNSCEYAFDGMCDEPGLCSAGTDTYDCENESSVSAMDEIVQQYGFYDFGDFMEEMIVMFGPMVVFIVAIWLFVALGRRFTRAGGALSEQRGNLVAEMERSSNNSYTMVEERRRHYRRLFEERAAALELDCEVLESSPGQIPAGILVRCKSANPKDPGVIMLGEAVLNLEAKPFHSYPVVMSTELNFGRKKRVWRNILKLEEGDIDFILNFIHTGKRHGRLRPVKERQIWWQLGRTKNSIPRLSKGGPLAPVIGLLRLFFRPTWYSVIESKPVSEPRHLIRLDSWKTSLSGTGAKVDDFKAELRRLLTSANQQDARFNDEVFAYPGIDGKVEREQMVIGLRRALAFVHVYQYGDDLYVAWEAHVNAGDWISYEVDRGFDRVTGKHARLVGLQPGARAVNEYDVMDADFLIEWLHAAVVKLVKLFIAEQKIDQEVDFSIQRESRQNVAGSNPGETKPKRRRASRES